MAVEHFLGILVPLGLCAAAFYLLTRPLRRLWKWIINGISGVVILYVLHLLSTVIPWNFLSITIAAILGVPGVAMILLRLLFFE